jgi:hypothetical protein
MDPEPYRQIIESLYQHETIYYSVEAIVDELQQLHDLKVSVRTLARWLQMWELRRYIRTDDTPELRFRIIALFFDSGLNDILMLKVLQKEGYTVTASKLRRIRTDLGLARRISKEAADLSTDALSSIVKTELDKGTILSYGKTMLHAHFQSLGVNVSRYVFNHEFGGTQLTDQ